MYFFEWRRSIRFVNQTCIDTEYNGCKIQQHTSAFCVGHFMITQPCGKMRKMKNTVEILTEGIEKVYSAKSVEEIIGIEGYCAQSYFSVFNKLMTNQKVPFTFELRTKRPPLDPVNAVLSFVYTLATSEFAAALETVGLDSYIAIAIRCGAGELLLPAIW